MNNYESLWDLKAKNPITFSFKRFVVFGAGVFAVSFVLFVLIALLLCYALGAPHPVYISLSGGLGCGAGSGLVNGVFAGMPMAHER